MEKGFLLLWECSPSPTLGSELCLNSGWKLNATVKLEGNIKSLDGERGGQEVTEILEVLEGARQEEETMGRLIEH